MKRTVYLNGEYLPEDEAKISIFDRGILFGDAIYEVGGVIDGKIISFESHMARYHRSLAELQIPEPLSEDEVLAAFRKLIELNNINEGLVYMEITRGAADRDFVWQEGLKPTVFMFTQPKPDDENHKVKTGVTLKSAEDIRWARRDIKSVNLLGQILAKKIASDAGAYEALMIDSDGFVTECGSMSFFMVRGDQILTRPLNNNILSGITRKSIIALCQQHDITLIERKFTLDEVLQADEAMVSGASSYVFPVTEIDGQTIGSGNPGPWFQRLYDIYVNFARTGAI
ncbi:MAG: D-amino acid aminotransferase [Gammaproteobacteria bacterium]|nr:D-amino acid aminotransferase [Gammaproteobacteria bacterium]